MVIKAKRREKRNKQNKPEKKDFAKLAYRKQQQKGRKKTYERRIIKEME